MATTAQEVYEQLLTRSGEASPRPRIEPVKRLAELLGSPQLEYPVIHVAGTNGKTSTSRAIESLLRAHGLRTGLFTSPHLVDFTERVQIDGEPINEAALVEVWDEMQPVLGVVDAELAKLGLSPISFFEALAVLAYTAFSDAPVDVAVVEIGMGGEWDATNIVDAEIAVFAPIGLDHTQILGSTLREIAETKAGIIKPDQTVVTAQQAPEVLQVLTERTRHHESSLLLAGRDFHLRSNRNGVGGRVIEVTGLSATEYEPLFLPLFGVHQGENALTAIAAVEAFFGLDRPLATEILEEGIAQLTSPGRLQAIAHNPMVLADSAHNPSGAAALAAAMREAFSFAELTVVIGVLADKDASGVVEQIVPLATQVFVTPVESERTLAVETLGDIVRELAGDRPVHEFDGLRDALEEARDWAKLTPGRGVLVVGSVILAGEAIAVTREADWGEVT